MDGFGTLPSRAAGFFSAITPALVSLGQTILSFGRAGVEGLYRFVVKPGQFVF